MNKHGFQISLTVTIKRSIKDTLIIGKVKSFDEAVVNRNKTWHILNATYVNKMPSGDSIYSIQKGKSLGRK